MSTSTRNVTSRPLLALVSIDTRHLAKTYTLEPVTQEKHVYEIKVTSSNAHIKIHSQENILVEPELSGSIFT